jgi:phosphopantothenoylcysteine decarboxylase/phosphopantothenate--cysteine ligase
VLFPAAVSDYSPKKVDGKIPSDHESLTIIMRRNPKLIDRMKGKFVVGFKAQAKMKDEELVKEALALMKRSKCSLVVANSIENVKKGKTKVIVVTPDGATEELEGTKVEVADSIIDRVARMVG